MHELEFTIIRPVMAFILTDILYNFKFEFFSVLQGISLINKILPDLRYYW